MSPSENRSFVVIDVVSQRCKHQNLHNFQTQRLQHEQHNLNKAIPFPTFCLSNSTSENSPVNMSVHVISVAHATYDGPSTVESALRGSLGKEQDVTHSTVRDAMDLP